MTEEQLDRLYDEKQVFLNAVRDAFRVSLAALPDDDERDAFKRMAQDELSLYSPWMNNV